MKKELGLLDATMIVMGGMIGSGIFLAPSLIAGIVHQSNLGAGNFVFIWIIGGVLTLCGALSYGELAASLPKAGGQYVYLKEAFSPFFGFLYGWTLFTVIQTGFIAAVAVAFANYLGVFFSWIGQSKVFVQFWGITVSTVQLVAILLILFLTWVNARGLREGAFVQNLFTLAKVAALLALIGFGLFSSKGRWANFQPIGPQAVNVTVLAAFAVAMSKALFAYDSWYTVTFVAEETRDPVRTLPRALALGTLGATLLYTLVNVVYLYILPLDQAANVADQRIAAAVSQVLLGPLGVSLIAIAILISTFGCDNGLILSGPRLYRAMAQDRLFFASNAKLDPKRGTPVRSLQYQALWGAILILSGSLGTRGAKLYSDLLTYTSFASLLFGTLTVVGLFVLRRKRPDLPRPYKVLAYPLIPLLYLAVGAFFIIYIAIGDPGNAGLGSIVILAGIPMYLYWKRTQRVKP